MFVSELEKSCVSERDKQGKLSFEVPVKDIPFVAASRRTWNVLGSRFLLCKDMMETLTAVSLTSEGLITGAPSAYLDSTSCFVRWGNSYLSEHIDFKRHCSV